MTDSSVDALISQFRTLLNDSTSGPSTRLALSNLLAESNGASNYLDGLPNYFEDDDDVLDLGDTNDDVVDEDEDEENVIDNESDGDSDFENNWIMHCKHTGSIPSNSKLFGRSKNAFL